MQTVHSARYQKQSTQEKNRPKQNVKLQTRNRDPHQKCKIPKYKHTNTISLLKKCFELAVIVPNWKWKIYRLNAFPKALQTFSSPECSYFPIEGPAFL